ncbi:hypothetical protein GGG87_02005 [Streptococcus sp. zg-86]|uniref:DUF6895 domain-containing protein n=1 Tax=Streptococcus zhangguiae TaxID=2664091 RepID=A0A6I4RAS3_9STRE|nr:MULTISPECIES: hypothetical protein [unclassified Streptococcus]MTB63786.1 hypothetical protein [Streptococcus sp. zg-86]MTB90096.1 hypothetical protein [Streptococcus sp. zg-36]MWV55768.1 hypothetical protein [Streptococcus sp. zg-70]QTH47946.1 hypothetical protein J5M87_00995 [Streptococcus sp. zg-86]
MKKAVLRSIEYIKKNINHFFVEELLQDDSDTQFKSFVELAFLYNLLSQRQIDLHHLEFIERFLKSKLSDTNQQGLLIKLVENNTHNLPGLLILEEFAQRKSLNIFKNYLTRLIEIEKIDSQIEKVPFRMMDLKYSISKIGLNDNLDSYNNLFHQTVLGKKLPRFYYTPNAMYSLTHTIFYISDLGSSYYLDNSPMDYVDLLTSLIGDRIIEKDLDILAELLLSVLFLKIDTDISEIIDYSIQFIIQNQNKNGSFPAPIEYQYNTDYEEFRNNYHTTLVCLGVLLCYQDKI